MTVYLSRFDPSATYAKLKQFDCGHDVINRFVRSSLKQQVQKNLSVAYVLTDRQQENRFVGFYTFAQHMIDVSLLSNLQLGSLPRSIPCSRLVMLGVDKDYKGQKFGAMLLKNAVVLTKSIGQQIGSFGMYLDADAAAVTFYQKLGFSLLEGNKSPDPSPMFLPMRSIP